MRRPAEFFDDRDVSLVHIAGTLRGALRLEALLTEHEIDYAVETDRYASGFFFVTEKTGAFFYVLASEAEAARALLRRHRFRVHRDE
jgi:hypothetical protein